MNKSENPSQSETDKPDGKKKAKKLEREEGEIDDEEDEYEQYSDEDRLKEARKMGSSRQEANQDSYDEDDEYCLGNKRLKIDEGEEQAQENKSLDADFSSASSAVSAFSASSVKTEISAISSTSLPLSTTSLKSDEESKTKKQTEKPKVPPLKIICSNPNGGLPYIKSQDAKNDSSHVSTRSKSSLKTSRTASPVPNTKNTPGRRSGVGRSSPSVKPQSASSPSSDSSSLCAANADTIIRRKLRSHTKQQQNGDTTPQKSSSSSPVDETCDEYAKAESKTQANEPQADTEVTPSSHQVSGQEHEQIMGNSTANCMKKFYEIQSVVTRQKEAQMQTNLQLQLPKNINEFLLIKKSYLIRQNIDIKQSIPLVKLFLI